MALLRKFGITYGYYPINDWLAAGKVDMIVESFQDCLTKYGQIYHRGPFDQSFNRTEEMTKFRDGFLGQYLIMCEQFLQIQGRNAKFIVGEELTIADFVLASVIFNIIDNPNSEFTYILAEKLDDFPRFNAYAQRLRTELSEHLDTRQQYPF